MSPRQSTELGGGLRPSLSCQGDPVHHRGGGGEPRGLSWDPHQRAPLASAWEQGEHPRAHTPRESFTGVHAQGSSSTGQATAACSGLWGRSTGALQGLEPGGGWGEAGVQGPHQVTTRPKSTGAGYADP